MILKDVKTLISQLKEENKTASPEDVAFNNEWINILQRNIAKSVSEYFRKCSQELNG